MSLVDVVSDVVVPAVRAVLRADEVSSIKVSTSAGSALLTLIAKGETFEDWVVQADVEGMSTDDWAERLRSNLVDFVAESRFGWGQNRDTPRK